MLVWPAYPDLPRYFLYLFDSALLWVLLTDGLGALIFSLWLIIKTHPRAEGNGEKEEAAAGPSG